MKHTSRQRRFSNFKVTEKYRFQFLGHWVLICLIFLALLDAAVFMLYQQMWQGSIPQGAAFAAEQANQYIKVGTTIILMSAIFASAILLLAVYTAHRIGGPLIALRRAMADVREGNLNRRLKFRKYDKMNDVEDDFNAMLDALQARFEGDSAANPDLKIEPEVAPAAVA